MLLIFSSSSSFKMLSFFLDFPPGRFDTSGSMIPLSVSEKSALDGFCDEDKDEEELGILVV